MCTSLWRNVGYLFSGLISRSVVAEPYARCMMKWLHCFPRSCNILPFHQKWLQVPGTTHPCQYLVWLVFAFSRHCVSIYLCFIVVSICISFVTNDVEHFPPGLICHPFIFPGEMFVKFCLFLNWIFFFSLYWVFSSWYILWI